LDSSAKSENAMFPLVYPDIGLIATHLLGRKTGVQRFAITNQLVRENMI